LDLLCVSFPVSLGAVPEDVRVRATRWADQSSATYPTSKLPGVRVIPAVDDAVVQTADVIFVADAPEGLVGQFADLGRKKLTELILGSEQGFVLCGVLAVQRRDLASGPHEFSWVVA